MKTVLFFARDPGAANVIIPIYRKMKDNYCTQVYAKEFAYERIKKEGICVANIEEICKEDEDEISIFLNNMNPDIVITGTSLNDYTERFLWKAAEKLGIKSYAILDQWMNAGIRFSEYSYNNIEEYQKRLSHSFMPTYILVMDDLVKKIMIEEGICEKKIIVTGQPYFDVVADIYEKSKPCYDNNYWNIVFISEPISQDYDNNDNKRLFWGYNEKTNFNILYTSVDKLTRKYGIKTRIVVRPHPREDKNNWETLIAELSNTNIQILSDTENDSYSILKSMDVVCGMSSMVLLEAFICKKDVISIEIGLKKDNPFVLDWMGLCKSVLNEKELLQKLENLLNQKQLDNQKKLNPLFYKKNATDNIIAFIEREWYNE